MDDLIGFLSEKDEFSLKDIQEFVDQRKECNKKCKKYNEISTLVSDYIMGPPANKCMNEKEKKRYDDIMEELMEDGVWNNEEILKKKAINHGLKL